MQFLGDNLLATTSVDQRLSVWRYDPVKSTIRLTSSFTHDVADAANLQALKNRLECQPDTSEGKSQLSCHSFLGTAFVLSFVVLEYNIVV